MWYNKVMKSNKGFTLIELLTVVAIIGIVMVVAAFSITTIRARTRDSVRVADIDTFVKGLDLYLNESGSYPIAVTETCIDGTDTVSAALETAGVLSRTIDDPIFVGPPQCIRYTSDGGGISYVIRYFLETGSVGTKGYNFIP